MIINRSRIKYLDIHTFNFSNMLPEVSDEILFEIDDVLYQEDDVTGANTSS